MIKSIAFITKKGKNQNIDIPDENNDYISLFSDDIMLLLQRKHQFKIQKFTINRIKEFLKRNRSIVRQSDLKNQCFLNNLTNSIINTKIDHNKYSNLETENTDDFINEKKSINFNINLIKKLKVIKNSKPLEYEEFIKNWNKNSEEKASNNLYKRLMKNIKK